VLALTDADTDEYEHEQGRAGLAFSLARQQAQVKADLAANRSTRGTSVGRAAGDSAAKRCRRRVEE